MESRKWFYNPGSFKAIDNTTIRSYDGGGHTIAGLRILPPLSGNESTALFAKNDQLTVKNLNIKDPYIQGRRLWCSSAHRYSWRD